MPSIEESLRALRDVQGVFGSFVVAVSGALVSHDLPAVYDGAELSELGPRLVRLHETLSTARDDLESVVLRYAEHKLYVRKMTWGVLGVISSVEVNMPALRMVGNLVVRRIDPEVAVFSPSTVPPPPRPRAAPPVEPPAAHPAVPEPIASPPRPAVDGAREDTHVRMYRGRRVLS